MMAAAAISTGPSYIASIGGDHVRVWSVTSSSTSSSSSSPTSTAKLLNSSMLHHHKPVRSLAWDASKQLLASVGDDGLVALSKGSGKVIGYLPESSPISSPESLHAVAFSPDSRCVASGGSTHTIHLWDVKKQEIRKQFNGHRDSISCIAFDSLGTHVASGSRCGDVIVHSIQTSIMSSQFRAATSSDLAGSTTTHAMRSVAYSPSHPALLACAGDTGIVKVWDTNTGTVNWTPIEHHAAPATCVAFSHHNHSLMASVGLDKNAVFYNMLDRKVIRTVHTPAPLTSLTFSSDGNLYAVGTVNGSVLMYDFRYGVTPTISIESHAHTSVSTLVFMNGANDSEFLLPTSNRTPASILSASSAPLDVLSPLVNRNMTTPISSVAARYLNTRRAADTVPITTDGDETPSVHGQTSIGTDGDMLSPVIFNPSSAVMSSIGDGKRQQATEYSTEKYPRPSAAIAAVGTDPYGIFSPMPVSRASNNTTKKYEQPLYETPSYTSDISTSITSTANLTSASSLRYQRRQEHGAANEPTTPLFTKSRSADPAVAIVPSVDVSSSLRRHAIKAAATTVDTPYMSDAVSAVRNTDTSSSIRHVPVSASEEIPVSTVTSASSMRLDRPSGAISQSTPSVDESTLLRHAGSSSVLETSPHAAASVKSESRTQNTTAPGDSHDISNHSHSTAAVSQPTTSAGTMFQTELIRSIVQECVDTSFSSLHDDIRNLHIEVLRQFEMQRNEFEALLNKHALNDELIRDIRAIVDSRQRHSNY